MTANGSTDEVTYYRCPVDGCTERQIKVRAKYEAMAMKKPQMCPRCEGVACEIDMEASRRSRGFFWLACPCCGWRVQIVRPDVERFAAKPTDRISDR